MKYIKLRTKYMRLTVGIVFKKLINGQLSQKVSLTESQKENGIEKYKGA